MRSIVEHYRGFNMRVLEKVQARQHVAFVLLEEQRGILGLLRREGRHGERGSRVRIDGLGPMMAW
jgi:hypothetical protein